MTQYNYKTNISYKSSKIDVNITNNWHISHFINQTFNVIMSGKYDRNVCYETTWQNRAFYIICKQSYKFIRFYMNICLYVNVL